MLLGAKSISFKAHKAALNLDKKLFDGSNSQIRKQLHQLSIKPECSQAKCTLYHSSKHVYSPVNKTIDMEIKTTLLFVDFRICFIILIIHIICF